MRERGKAQHDLIVRPLRVLIAVCRVGHNFLKKAVVQVNEHPKEDAYLSWLEGAIVTERPFMHDGVDWKAAPKTAQWWAVDANRKAHWFKAPNVAAFTDFWFTESEQAPLFGYSGDWRESLTRRP